MKAAALLFALVGLQSSQLQTNQVFRSQAAIASIDVIVTDKSGKIVRGLKPDDFVVSTKRRQRQVVSADFVEARPSSRRPAAVFPDSNIPVAAPSTNRFGDPGRVFVLAVNAGMIGRGEGRNTMQEIGEFLDHLAPEDFVGLVTLPIGTPRLGLTQDRAAVRAALRSIVGMADRYSDCGYTYGEAAAFVIGDARMAERARTERLGVSASPCLRSDSPPELTTPEYRIQTRTLFDSLGAIADGLRGRSGAKTIVLIGEGLFLDRDMDDEVRRLGARAEAAGTRVYSLQLNSPMFGQGNANATTTHHLNDVYGFAAMETVASATGGAAFRSTGSIIPRLDRIEEESSAFYMLGVEIDPAEREIPVIDLKVTSRRPGLNVRARWSFSGRARANEKVTAPSPTAISAEAASILAAELLRNTQSVNQIPMDVDTLTAEAAAGQSSARQAIVTDIAKAPAEIAAVGFHVATASGRTVALKIEPSLALPASPIGAGYLVAVDLEPGPYRVTVVAVDIHGALGSVSRSFAVPEPAARPAISMTLLGVNVGGTSTIPIAALAPGQAQLGVRVTWPPLPPNAGTPVVRILIGRSGQTDWLGQLELPATGDAASTAITTSKLAPGLYLLKAELRVGGDPKASTSKSFEIR